jgi:hypothetical protein
MIKLRETLVLLARSEVDFVIVGGVAATLQGSVLQTFDLDICYSRDPKNLDRLAAALAPLQPGLRGAPPGIPFVWDSRTLRNGLNFTLTTALGDIDLLGDIAGIGAYPEVRAKSRTVSMYGLAFFILTLGGLIEAKLAAGREKDLRALPELEALREAMEEDEPNP